MWVGTGFILLGILILLIAIKYERQYPTFSHGSILYWGIILGFDFVIFGISYLVIGHPGEWIEKYWGLSFFVIFILALFLIAAKASEW